MSRAAKRYEEYEHGVVLLAVMALPVVMVRAVSVEASLKRVRRRVGGEEVETAGVGSVL